LLRHQITMLGLFIAILASATLLSAQVRPGRVIVPESSRERNEDVGIRAHTNHLILASEDVQSNATSPQGETPASLGCVYALVSSLIPGCPIKGTSINPAGGSGIIAIVDAYDDPHAAGDLNLFSKTFGFPQCNATNPCFHKVYASGTKPAVDCGWAQEESLDIEWAHAMAPGATIVLVEAASSSLTDLLKAVKKAVAIITTQGARSGEVSMSWSSSEFAGETTLDSYFKANGVVFFASSGDTGGVNGWPSVSPNVVSAGGTTVNRNASGNFINETGWSGSGGGPSAFESRPSYQDFLVSLVGSQRGAPDFSFDANPNSGVSVYDSTPCGGYVGWLVFGGTSVASPALAGIVNAAGRFFASSDMELSTIYSNLGSPADFTDITSGTAGHFQAIPGWDFVTGVGTDVGLAGK